MNWITTVLGLPEAIKDEIKASLSADDATNPSEDKKPEGSIRAESAESAVMIPSAELFALEAEKNAIAAELAKFKADAMQAKTDAAVGVSKAWADKLTSDGKILPVHAEGFAALHTHLSALPEGTTFASFELKADGSEPDQLSAIQFIEQAMSAHGWNKDHTQGGVKVQANRSQTAMKNNTSASGDINLMTDEEAKAMALAAFGK